MLNREWEGVRRGYANRGLLFLVTDFGLLGHFSPDNRYLFVGLSGVRISRFLRALFCRDCLAPAFIRDVRGIRHLRAPARPKITDSEARALRTFRYGRWNIRPYLCLVFKQIPSRNPVGEFAF